MNKRWVSNTSPLILLNKIGYLPLLTELCAELIIPKGVIDELFFHKEEQSRWELNKMLKQDFGISGIIYDGALKIAKEARNKGND